MRKTILATASASGFRGPLAGPFSAGPSQPGADARTDITWRATTPATPTDIGVLAATFAHAQRP
jgi:hypothetical protein